MPKAGLDRAGLGAAWSVGLQCWDFVETTVREQQILVNPKIESECGEWLWGQF